MKIKTVDYCSASAGKDFVCSLHETGFAVLHNHPVPDNLLKNLDCDWRSYFDSEEKARYLFTNHSVQGERAGFFPLQVSETAVRHATKDLKEFLHVVPDGPLPPECARSTYGYKELGLTMGAAMLGWLQEYTPASRIEHLDESLSDMLCEHASLLRILHYPPLSGLERQDAVRAAAHEDINLLTILPVSEQPGLQAKDNDGNWIEVFGGQGDILINSGDMLREATGGYYPSTTHRVINPTNGEQNISRLSMPFFLTPRRDVILSKRYTAGGYLDERLTLINR